MQTVIDTRNTGQQKRRWAGLEGICVKPSILQPQIRTVVECCVRSTRTGMWRFPVGTAVWSVEEDSCLIIVPPSSFVLWWIVTLYPLELHLFWDTLNGSRLSGTHVLLQDFSVIHPPYPNIILSPSPRMIRWGLFANYLKQPPKPCPVVSAYRSS